MANYDLDEAEQDARVDAMIREERWAQFVSDCRVIAAAGNFCEVTQFALDAWRASSAQPGSFGMACLDFAETEQWSGVLAAISLAMREAGE